jgi:hypothetical protein
VDARTTVFLGLGTILALNHVLVRTELARRFRVLFWTVAVTDTVLAVGVALFGVPGFPQGMVRLLVVLVLLMHLAQNLQHRLRWAAEDREAALDAEYEAYRKATAEAEAPAPADAQGE